MVAEPRRIGSICAAISGGRYDFVIAVTGFISHTTERCLRRAIGKQDVALVRAYKGRTLSCLQALERELGLQTKTK